MGSRARTAVLTARIEHVCSLCGGSICVGEKYTRRYRDDHRGRARYVKKCNGCAGEYIASVSTAKVPA